MNNRHIDKGDERHDCCPSAPNYRVGWQPPQRQVPEIRDEQQNCGRKSRIPLPICSPGDFPPQHSCDKRDPGENDTNFSRGTR